MKKYYVEMQLLTGKIFHAKDDVDAEVQARQWADENIHYSNINQVKVREIETLSQSDCDKYPQ